jgi:hypothetical protein
LGLDAVEIILRTEEVFAVDLPDSDCSKVNTVGDLYRLLLEKLKLPYLSPESIENPDEPARAGYNRVRSHSRGFLSDRDIESVVVCLGIGLQFECSNGG